MTRLSQTNSMVLNLLRVLAAHAVVIGHALSFGQLTLLKDGTYFPYIQNIGVDIMFLLSGFLFAYSMRRNLDRERYSFNDYLINRIIRIYIPYIAALLFVVVISVIHINFIPYSFDYYKTYNLKMFIGNLLMLQNFPGTEISTFSSGRQFWTLALEWWYYIFFGYLLLSFVRKKKKNIVDCVLLFFLAIVPIRNIAYNRGGGLTRLWLIGALIYLLYDKVKFKSKLIHRIFVIVLIGGVLVCGLVTKDAYSPLFKLSLSLLLLVLMTYGNRGDLPRVNEKTSRILKVLASYTYSLYLVHYSLMDFAFKVFSNFSPELVLIVSCLASNIIAIVFAYLFESKKSFVVVKITDILEKY